MLCRPLRRRGKAHLSPCFFFTPYSLHRGAAHRSLYEPARSRPIFRPSVPEQANFLSLLHVLPSSGPNTISIALPGHDLNHWVWVFYQSGTRGVLNTRTPGMDTCRREGVISLIGAVTNATSSRLANLQPTQPAHRQPSNTKHLSGCRQR
ncbi:uncharacterized protein LY79DRAFT_113689 [Colletotrichum navitas]|uniref:Uncharacterized protein n=1 Tax=Colletotrichum navitas TaxID=681940 RepID=A0AAD8PKU4_9PEZI|nr:uncharacterized protein LY79DRAFT_113689 [Colletotrichum navitas]KAK1566035.1 hypothetical protein LY79DRAFT_113689 [Colletotrichum navitas]